MPEARLSGLDASFLDVEGPTAHMHVGWASTFSPPDDGPRPSFEELRDHIAGRLGRAPRYRQKLAPVPFDVDEPVWVDDEDFDPARHILRARSAALDDVVEEVMSHPLERDRPLWEMWIAERLEDGRVGMVGKAHHCMVDGIAAVELTSVLLDPSPEPEEPGPDGWRPQAEPGPGELLSEGLGRRARDAVALAGFPLRLARSPQRLFDLPGAALRTGRTLARAAVPLAPESPLNAPSSSQRHLARLCRPLEDLRAVKRRFHTTVNDVLLAACAGGLRSFLAGRGDEPRDLKVMVPVNVRDEHDEEGGNRISFLFVELPCSEPDPVERLVRVHADVSGQRKDEDPERADSAIKAVEHAPRPVQRLVSQAVASPRLFNLVVSNIPGPRMPLWMLGCRLEDAYPVVPLAESHALSIGMTTVGDQACFGFYADRQTLPDADLLAEHVNAALDELIELSG
jgi:diacylglycerol O-acyltransferase / wax synthase